MSVTVPLARAEAARAAMIELFPEGFEERGDGDGVELAAYTNAAGEERLWHTFGSSTGSDVAEGWEERWRDFHRPVRAGSVWIAPPWEKPHPHLTTIVIEPGRAFGTGGHATTRLCLELLEELPRGSLLDVGCGSGVLSIAAARLGFSPVVALDHDPLAVEATLANAERNGVAVEVRLADGLSDTLPAVDVGLANIALDPVEVLAPRLCCERFVTSGYLAAEAPVVPGFRLEQRLEEGGWAADLHRRHRQ